MRSGRRWARELEHEECLGGVLMGALAERVGEPGAVALGAACLFAVALLARWLTPALKGLE